MNADVELIMHRTAIITVAIILIGAGVLILAMPVLLSPVIDLILPPPAIETIIPETLTMAGPVHSSYSRGGGRFALVPAQTVNARISNICFIWNCGVSPEVAALASGDRITVWMQDDRIWQMAKGNHLLLDYRVALSAYDRHKKQFDKEMYTLSMFLLVPGVLLGLIGLWRDRKLRQSPKPNDL